MCNQNSHLDKLFRPLDILRVKTKKIAAKIGLKNAQSCKYCGRDQHIVWKVPCKIWNTLPKAWHNKCLCLECFYFLMPENSFSPRDVEILY